MAYNPISQRIMLVGGRIVWLYGQPGTMLDDIWEYDGVDWVQQTPIATPQPQLNSWLGYEPNSNRMMMFGGTGNPSPAGTWFYDGTTWTAGPYTPVFNSIAGIATDPVRQRIVAFDWGVGSSTVTWEYDGVAWNQIPVTTAPSQRVRPRMVYDENRGAVMLYGGSASPQPPTDMWQWDGQNWLQVATAAPPRRFHDLAYDPDTDVLFAVGDVYPFNTVRWDGISFVESDPVLGHDDVANAYYDFNRQRVVAFSRYPIGWCEWDGVRWHRQPSPLTLLRPELAFDLVRSRAVALGDQGFGALVTTEWDGSNWTTPVPAAVPCVGHLTYHTGRARVVTSCGSGGLWQWDGTSWTSLAPGPGAPWSAVEDGHVAYDEARGELVQVKWQGGTLHTAVWNNGWNITTATTGPSVRVDYGLTFDYDRQRLAMFGGHDPAPSFPVYTNELWEWDGSAWSQRIVPGGPNGRSGGGFVYDHGNQQLLAIAGNRHLVAWTSSPLADMWALDSRPAATEQVLGPGCGGTFLPRLVAGATWPGADVVAFELHDCPPVTPIMFGFGLASGNVPVGAGCTQYLANQDQLWLGFSNSAGIATTTATIPLALHGFSFVVQGAALDAGNALGVSLSAGHALTVGH